MPRAIELAWQGWGRVAPNPLVGAVVLRDGEIIGEGFHAEYGERHAEAVALAAAGDGARGATLVVTLEPCAHQGKQPALRRPGSPRRHCARGGGGGRPEPGGGGRRRLPAAAWCRGGDRPAAAGGGGAERGVPPCAGLAAPAVRGAQAGHVARCPHRRSRGTLALDQRTRRAGLGAVAACRIRCAGRRRHTARLDDPSLTVRGTLVPRRTPRRVVFGRSSQLSAEAALAQTARETPTTVFVAPGTGAAQGALARPAWTCARRSRWPRHCARCGTRRSRACWSRAVDSSPVRCWRRTWSIACTGCRARSGWARACRR